MRSRELRVCTALLTLAAFGTAFTSPVRAQTETAGQMATYCSPYRHALRLAPRAGGGDIVEAPGANAKSDFCWGAFATMQDLVILRQGGAIELYLKAPEARRICPPITVQRLQMVKAFLLYMDDHRDLGNTDFGVALLYAMSAAFPCPPGN